MTFNLYNENHICILININNHCISLDVLGALFNKDRLVRVER